MGPESHVTCRIWWWVSPRVPAGQGVARVWPGSAGVLMETGLAMREIRPTTRGAYQLPRETLPNKWLHWEGLFAVVVRAQNSFESARLLQSGSMASGGAEAIAGEHPLKTRGQLGGSGAPVYATCVPKLSAKL